MTRLLALGGVAGPILFTAACIGVAGLTERIVVTEVFLWFVALGWVARRSSDVAQPAVLPAAA